MAGGLSQDQIDEQVLNESLADEQVVDPNATPEDVEQQRIDQNILRDLEAEEIDVTEQPKLVGGRLPEDRKDLQVLFGEKTQEQIDQEIFNESTEPFNQDIRDPENFQALISKHAFTDSYISNVNPDMLNEVNNPDSGVFTELGMSAEAIWRDDNSGWVWKLLNTFTLGDQFAARLALRGLIEQEFLDLDDTTKSRLKLMLGQDQVHPSDIVDFFYTAGGKGEKWGEFGVGLLADIFFDPLTYLTLGGAGAVKIGNKLLKLRGLDKTAKLTALRSAQIENVLTTKGSVTKLLDKSHDRAIKKSQDLLLKKGTPEQQKLGSGLLTNKEIDNRLARNLQDFNEGKIGFDDLSSELSTRIGERNLSKVVARGEVDHIDDLLDTISTAQVAPGQVPLTEFGKSQAVKLDKLMTKIQTGEATTLFEGAGSFRLFNPQQYQGLTVRYGIPFTNIGGDVTVPFINSMVYRPLYGMKWASGKMAGWIDDTIQLAGENANIIAGGPLKGIDLATNFREKYVGLKVAGRSVGRMMESLKTNTPFQLINDSLARLRGKSHIVDENRRVIEEEGHVLLQQLDGATIRDLRDEVERRLIRGQEEVDATLKAFDKPLTRTIRKRKSAVIGEGGLRITEETPRAARVSERLATGVVGTKESPWHIGPLDQEIGGFTDLVNDSRKSLASKENLSLETNQAIGGELDNLIARGEIPGPFKDADVVVDDLPFGKAGDGTELGLQHMSAPDGKAQHFTIYSRENGEVLAALEVNDIGVVTSMATRKDFRQNVGKIREFARYAERNGVDLTNSTTTPAGSRGLNLLIRKGLPSKEKLQLAPANVDRARRARLAAHPKAQEIEDLIEGIRSRNMDRIAEMDARQMPFRELDPFGDSDQIARGYLKHIVTREWLSHFKTMDEAMDAAETAITSLGFKMDRSLLKRQKRDIITAINNESTVVKRLGIGKFKKTVKKKVPLFVENPVAIAAQRDAELKQLIHWHDFLDEITPTISTKPRPGFSPLNTEKWRPRGKEDPWYFANYVPKQWRDILERNGTIYLPDSVVSRVEHVVNPNRFNGVGGMALKALRWYNSLFRNAALFGTGYIGQNLFGNLLTYGYAGGSAKWLGKALALQPGRSSQRSIKIAKQDVPIAQVYDEMLEDGILKSSLVEEIHYDQFIENLATNSPAAKKIFGIPVNTATQVVDVLALYRLNRWAARFGDDYPKMAHYLSLRDAGYTRTAAAQSTDYWFFNFQNVSPGQRFIREVIPFSTFAVKVAEQSMDLLKKGDLAKLALPAKTNNVLQGTYVPHPKVREAIEASFPEYRLSGFHPVLGPIMPGMQQIMIDIPWAKSAMNILLTPETSKHPVFKVMEFATGMNRQSKRFSSILTDDEMTSFAGEQLSNMLPPTAMWAINAMEINGVEGVPFYDFRKRFAPKMPLSSRSDVRGLTKQRFVNAQEFGQWMARNHGDDWLFNLFSFGKLKPQQQDEKFLQRRYENATLANFVKKYFRQLTFGLARIEPLDRNFLLNAGALRREQVILNRELKRMRMAANPKGMYGRGSLNEFSDEQLAAMEKTAKQGELDIIKQLRAAKDQERALLSFYGWMKGNLTTHPGLIDAIFGLKEERFNFDPVPPVKQKAFQFDQNAQDALDSLIEQDALRATESRGD